MLGMIFAERIKNVGRNLGGHSTKLRLTNIPNSIKIFVGQELRKVLKCWIGKTKHGFGPT